MIQFIQLEKLTVFLATLAPLIDEYKAGNFAFPVKAMDWLQQAEDLMSSLRLPEGAEMSSLRAMILKAGDTAKDDAGHRTRSSIRRDCNAAAADVLSRAEGIMRSRIAAAEDRLAHFEEKLCEALTAAALVNAIPQPPSHPRQVWLRQVWDSISQHQSIRPTTVYLATSLFAADRLYLLDKVTNRLFENDMSVMNSAPKSQALTASPALKD